jgi:hypothetical protein
VRRSDLVAIGGKAEVANRAESDAIDPICDMSCDMSVEEFLQRTMNIEPHFNAPKSLL